VPCLGVSRVALIDAMETYLQTSIPGARARDVDDIAIR
jgi:hypothetical protein